MRNLLLSGWAQPPDALAVLAPDALTFDYSDYPNIETAIAALRHVRCDALIAWSLGGVVALRAIAAGALIVRHLTLLSVPYQFVRSEAFQHAMDTFVYQQFVENYTRDPARTQRRFSALIAKGDARAPHVMAALRYHPQVEETARWLPWLTALSARSLPEDAPPITVPTLLVHGQQDAIVSARQAQSLAKHVPQHHLVLWENAGHALHLHDTERLRAQIAMHRQSVGL